MLLHYELLRWVRHMVSSYRPDALRLDTAAYVPREYLREFQTAANVEVRPCKAFLRSRLHGRAVGSAGCTCKRPRAHPA